ncbi:MAG: chromosome segregation protein SMC [Oscillospiraceae bacterium]|nr:chromosome segregation protein SMC [Oscillospiraceae bacterium]
MRLTALEIQGFKSFPDKTKITIGNGITAVVGPNGSGKSNISDAIRWVLGETSSKQLRGGGKMEDVIFGGTQQRSAMGFAGVSLYIDNNDRRLDIESDEVIIGRKYYRSGESEYNVNGQNVRLKDIYELFLDTGLGRDGYSIIGQGRIAEIVGAKSAERREIFEEASGIAKYRYRKNEAERRLASTEDNMVRLRDILNELEERVGPLEKECAKAKKFIEFSQQKKELEVTLWVDTIRRARDTVRDQQRKMEIAQADYDRQTDEITALDAQTESVRVEIERLILDVEKYNGDIREISEEISGSDARIAVLKNDISHNAATIDNLLAEISQSTQGNSAITQEIEKHKQEIETISAQVAVHTARIQQLEEMLADIVKKNLATGERRGTLASRLNEMVQRVNDLKVEAAFSKSTADSAALRLESAKLELTNATAMVAEGCTEKEENEKYLVQINEKAEQLENMKAGMTLKLQSRTQNLQSAGEEVQKVDRVAEATMQRIHMLQELERNMDGFLHSVKTVMKAGASHRLRGLIGPVSTILTVKPGYEVAIETALGAALQNIVVEDENAAKAAMAFLKEERAGRATFLPLNTMRPSTFNADGLSGSAAVASSLVQYDARYENIVSNLLGRIVVVDDINEASRVAKAGDYRFRIVTVDGQVINAGGSFTGGSVSKSAGLFSRKQEIDDLKKKAESLKASRTQAVAAMEKIKAEVDKLSAEAAATESELITLKGDKIRCEVELERMSTALNQNRAVQAQLESECQSLQETILQAKEKAQQTAEEITALHVQIETLKTEINGIDDGNDSFIETQQRLSTELGETKLARLGCDKDSDMHRQAISALQSRTGEAEQRARNLKENIARLQALNTENEKNVSAILQEKQQAQVRISACEEQIKAASEARIAKEGTITGKANRVRELTGQREALSAEVARLAERKAALETEYDQTVAKLWEEYELTFSGAEQLCISFENTAELRRQVNEVRSKIKNLGNVNVGAIEEYAEVSERYTFMKKQVDDVEKAKQELLRLITELSAEMRNIFSASFVEINKNFGRIFAELFGGGHAQLSLSDEENVLESGIEIEVAPPGKIIKNLSSLSGGEQALVAISIYFAILAVNPAPFCILDEIEAALDDVNVTRFAQYLRRITGQTQFIVITHRRGTMEEADVLYGVTMQEDGVSKLLKLDVNNVDAHLVS